MNSELKALVSTGFDVEKLVVDGVKKSYFSLIGDALCLVSDLPGDISGFAGIQAEIVALTHAENMADLVAFVQLKFSSIEQLSGVRAQAVIAALINLIGAAIAVEQAFVQ